MLNGWLQFMRSVEERRLLNLTHDRPVVHNLARAEVPLAQNSPHAALVPIIKANAEEQPPQAATGRRGIHLIYHSRFEGHCRIIGHPRYAGWFGFVRNRTIRTLSDAGRATNSRATGQRSRATFHLDSRPFAGRLSSARGRLPLQGAFVPGLLHSNWKLA
jgi:hypothetical protein